MLNEIMVPSLNDIKSVRMCWTSWLYLARVPHGMVIGQVHELVDQIWLVQVAGQRAQLFVGGQSLAAGDRGNETDHH